MANNKLLLAVLLFVGYIGAAWAFVFLFPSCPIPTSVAGGYTAAALIPSSDSGLSLSSSSDPAAAGNSDSEQAEFCVPDWDCMPRGSFYVLVGSLMGWFTVRIYEYFAASPNDDATRAAVARKLLVMAALLVGNAVVLHAAIVFLPRCPIPPFHVKIYPVLDWRVVPESDVFVLVGAFSTWVSTKIYEHFTDDDEEAFRAAKKYGYVTIVGGNDDDDDYYEAGGKN